MTDELDAKSAKSNKANKNTNNNNNNNSSTNNTQLTNSSDDTDINGTVLMTIVDSTKDSTATNNNNNGECQQLVSEATKLLLKNGLNGITTVASNQTQQQQKKHLPLTSTPTTTTTTKTHLQTALEGIADSNKINIGTEAGRTYSNIHKASPNASGATSQIVLSNGISPVCPVAPAPGKSNNNSNNNIRTSYVGDDTDMAAVVSVASATATGAVGTPPSAHRGVGGGDTTTITSAKDNNGVIDYTIAGTNYATAPITASGNNSSAAVATSALLAAAVTVKGVSGSVASHKMGGGGGYNDIGRHPISNVTPAGNNVPGGRLQFFKDGKFILELARAKEGDRGGWISVPRKPFRTPSATSSTVTPTPVSASAYPKNESSTSLSFSDDNSSIQSSPWQRDHCWKQTSPRQGISKEMSLLYVRPKGLSLTHKGSQLALRKRRRPYDAIAALSRDIFTSRITLTNTATTKEHQNESTDSDDTLKAATEVSEVKSCSTSRQTTSDVIEDGDQKNIKATQAEELDAKKKEQQMDCIEMEVVGEKMNPPTTDQPQSIVPESDQSIEKEVPVIKDETMKPAKLEHKIKIECNKMVEEMKPEKEVVDPMEKDEGEDTKTTVGSPHHFANGGNTITQDANSIDAIVTLKKEVTEDSTEKASSSTKTLDATKNEAGEEKRLKKIDGSSSNSPTRAKLNTVIQKLIDRMPARKASLAKILPLSALTSSNTGFLNTNSQLHKVSPLTSSSSMSASAATATATASSRLVEYHQQHVSPRKRMLREFEKVSLEDQNTSPAGGKRSRAKGSNNNCIGTSNNGSITNSNCNSNGFTVQNNGTAFPPSSASSSPVHVIKSPPQHHRSNTVNALCTTVTTAENATNGSNTVLPSSTALASSLTSALTASSTKVCAPSTTSTASAPQRLYSSYSIHSLLGGGAGGAGSDGVKKSGEATIISSLNHSQQPYGNLIDPAFGRSSLISPQSPDGGKSPSASAIHNKKRSPPYSSPIRDIHARSPNVSHLPGGSGGSVDYTHRSPQATPPENSCLPTNHKMRFSTTEHIGGGGGSGTGTGQPPYSSQQQQQQQHNHHLHHQQGFYSPYMMSPKYVPAPAAISPTSSAPTAIARSPRHSSAFSSTSSTSSSSSASGSVMHAHIPHSPSPSTVASAHSPIAPPAPSVTGIGVAMQRDFSPPRSTTASPREATPRTVPKKTASIRRQFASPTMSANSNNNNNNSNQHQHHGSSPLPSYTDEIAAQSATSSSGAVAQQEQHRKSALVSPHHQILSRGSPLGPGGGGGVSVPSPSHALHYYMYPPSMSPGVGPAAAVSPSAAAVAAAAAAAAYIPQGGPSTYYQYLSSLAAMRQNPMWLHQYPGGMMPSTSQYPTAAVAAAAAASSNSSLQAVMSQSFASGAGGGFPSSYGNNPHSHHHLHSAPPPQQPALASPHHHHTHMMAAATSSSATPSSMLQSGYITSSHSRHSPKPLSLDSSEQQHVSNRGGGESSASGINRGVPTATTIAASMMGHHYAPHVAGNYNLPQMKVCSAGETSHIPLYPNNVKDEHSSDVPLNLSKH